MKRISIIALLAAGALLGSCRFVTLKDNASDTEGVVSGTVLSEKGVDGTVVKDYDVEEFDSVVCMGAFDITYSKGSRAVRVQATEKDMETLNVYVRDRTLYLDNSKRKAFGKKLDIDVEMSTDSLCALEINGAVEFESKGGISAGKQFNLTVNGASDIEIDSIEAEQVRICSNGAADARLAGIDAAELNVQINGAADLTLAGRVTSADIQINGAGDIDTSHLEAQSMSKRVNGRSVK